MQTTGALLIGFGILVLSLGVHFIRVWYARGPSNDEYGWAGFGENPFRK